MIKYFLDIKPTNTTFHLKGIGARCLLLGFVILALAACNNEGSGTTATSTDDSGDGETGDVDSGNGEDGVESAPAKPMLSFSPQRTKTFSFNWEEVDGVSEYRLLENPDGLSGYTQVATIAADSTSYDLEVFLPGRINAEYMLAACNSIGCSDSEPVFVSGTLAEAVGNIKPANVEAEDQFGYSTAISADGSSMAVGAVNKDSSAGAVYLYTYSNGEWLEQDVVKASNAEAGDRFGHSVALSADGKTLAVGAVNEDSNATDICAPIPACTAEQNDNSAIDSGAVYVFTYSNGEWLEQAYVKAFNAGAGDQFGHSVALSADGDTLAVGAVAEDGPVDNFRTDSGAVYVFVRSAGTWSQQAYVRASNADSGDKFGWSVAVSDDGNTLAIGAIGEESRATCGFGGCTDDNQFTNFFENSGAVYLFTRNDNTWSQQAYVKASNTGAGDEFGYSVSLAADGDTLAVGAPFEDGDSTGINQPQNNEGPDSGAVYIYVRSGASWFLQAYMKASNTGDGDRFGFTVSLAADGNTLAVGAPFEDGNSIGINQPQNDEWPDSGAVYVFTRSGVIWSQQAYVKASDSGDRFGFSLSLTGDGSTLLVGSDGDDSNTVYVY